MPATPPAAAGRHDPAATGTATRPARLALPVAVVAGALVALQQRLNGELEQALGDALLTAVVSFGSGLLVVAVAVLLRPSARAALPLLRGTTVWERLGGLGGATLVLVGAYATPRLGVALLTVGLVAGQTGGALLVDRAGVGPGGVRPLTGPRPAGALLCLAAVAVGALGDAARAASPLLLALVVLAGALTSVQQALNGRVRALTGDATVATALNFVVGTAALGLGLALRAAAGGLQVGHWPGQWWLYLGGTLGVVFVASAAVVVRTLGVLRLGLAVIAGQLVGAVLLDLLLPVGPGRLSAATVVGAALTLGAAVVSGRRTSRDAGTAQDEQQGSEEQWPQDQQVDQQRGAGPGTAQAARERAARDPRR